MNFSFSVVYDKPTFFSCCFAINHYIASTIYFTQVYAISLLASERQIKYLCCNMALHMHCCVLYNFFDEMFFVTSITLLLQLLHIITQLSPLVFFHISE